MVELTPPDARATEPAVEILLVQHDQKQCALTLDVIQSRHLADRIHVLRDGAEALEFLFRTGAYADRQPVNPRLVLFHLRLAEGDDIEVLQRIRRDPRTSEVPITVLASSSDDRLAAMSELHEYGLSLPVVVVSRPMPRETVRALEGIACGSPIKWGQEDEHDIVSVVDGADDPRRPAHTGQAGAVAQPTIENLCLERDLDAVIRVARAAAHEFNNLFSVIVAYTELLLKDLDFDDPRRAGADEIFRSIGRASRLTRDLLTFRPTAERTSEQDDSQRPAPRPPNCPSRAGVS